MREKQIVYDYQSDLKFRKITFYKNQLSNVPENNVYNEKFYMQLFSNACWELL